MNQLSPLNELKEQLASAQNILIAFPKKASFDQVAASLALYLSIRKAGKKITVASPEPMRVEFSHLVGVDKVVDKLAGEDLLITLNYPIEKIFKASSNNDGGKLNLVVKLKPGAEPISSDQVILKSGGINFDLIFLIGVNQAQDLGQLLDKNQESLNQNQVVNINNKPVQVKGTDFINDRASGTTEIVAEIIRALTLPIDEDIGSNLIQGLKEASQDFSISQVSPATFEAAAFAMRMGGRTKGAPSPASESQAKKEEKKPAPDWYEPKIYQGTSIS